MITIAAGPDDLVSARMPALAERRALGILAPDVPVLSLKRPGQAEESFNARLVEIVASGLLHDQPERPILPAREPGTSRGNNLGIQDH